MLKITKLIITIVIILAIIGGGTFYAWNKGLLPWSHQELKIDDTANIVTGFKNLSEFVSMEYYDEFTMEFTKVNPLADNAIGSALTDVIDNVFGEGKAESVTADELVLISRGKVSAGFNLAKITENDVRISGDTLYLNLPKAEILSAPITPSGFEAYIEEGNWDEESMKEPKKKAREELKARAIKAGILEKARDNGVAELTRMYKTLGFNDVVCKVEE